eukprot:8808247-Pyramimonas_sp.AAC.2
MATRARQVPPLVGRAPWPAAMPDYSGPCAGTRAPTPAHIPPHAPFYRCVFITPSGIGLRSFVGI